MATVLDPYALTTLEKANYYLGLTADGGAVDTYVERLINQASDMIEEALLRKLMVRVYTKERYTGKGQETLYFKQYPVLAVNLDELVWDAVAKTVTRSDSGGSFVKDGFADGNEVMVQNSDLNSGLLTISGVVTAFVITFDEVIVADLSDDNVIISHFRSLWINDSEVAADDYEVNENHIYYRGGFSVGHENVRMSYYAGYYGEQRHLPYDIEAKCWELIKAAYDKEKDVKSEKIGPYSITFFDNKAKIMEMIRNDLSTYINVVI